MQQKRAKELLRAAWAGDADGLKRIRALHQKPPGIDALKLSDTQLVVARSYGFESWAAMGQKIASLTKTPVERFADALHAGDEDRVRTLLERHAEVRAAVNAPSSHFDSRPVARAKKNLTLLDVLLAYGADLNLKSAWWAGGFGLLEHDCTPEEAAPLIQRSEIAQRLIDGGADINARDVVHESTPAQYLVREAPDVTRLLVKAGAWFDIFIAVGLRDTELVERCLRDDPEALDHRIWQGKHTVAHNGRRPATREEIGDRRGDVYRWVFDHDASAIDVATRLGCNEILDLLLHHASPVQRLLAACAKGDRATAPYYLTQRTAVRPWASACMDPCMDGNGTRATSLPRSVYSSMPANVRIRPTCRPDATMWMPYCERMSPRSSAVSRICPFRISVSHYSEQEARMPTTYKRAVPYAQDAMNLPVGDVERAVPFYERIMGFHVIERRTVPEAAAILGRDNVRIGLAENGGDPTQEGCFFEVDDVEAAFAELKANGLNKDDAGFRVDRHGDTSYRVFFVVAPDGLCYCLGERQP